MSEPNRPAGIASPANCPATATKAPSWTWCRKQWFRLFHELAVFMACRSTEWPHTLWWVQPLLVIFESDVQGKLPNTLDCSVRDVTVSRTYRLMQPSITSVQANPTQAWWSQCSATTRQEVYSAKASRTGAIAFHRAADTSLPAYRQKV